MMQSFEPAVIPPFSANSAANSEPATLSSPSASAARSTTNGKFRLLVVSSDSYPPTRVDVTVLFGEELAKRGHRIDWILQSEGACAEPYATPWGSGQVWVGATDLGTSLWRRVRKHCLSILHDMKLFGALRSGDYDVIEVKDKFISGIFAAIAARLFRKGFVYWLSYPFPEDYLLRARNGNERYPLLYLIRGTVFSICLYRILLRAADHVFVQSEQMRRDVAAHGIPLEKMTAVPMGINVERFVPRQGARDRSLMPPGEPCILYLGTLMKVRRLDFLVRVLAGVRKDVPAAKLYLVGRGDDPSDEKLLLDEAKRLHLESALIMVGQVPQALALQYVDEADVCLSPFYPTPVLNSTSPTKLVEYLAMGKAVVANDHPEQKLVIGESGAGICVSWDEQAFAAAIVELLRDPARARDMGVRGRHYALERRSYRMIADPVERVLLKVAAGDSR